MLLFAWHAYCIPIDTSKLNSSNIKWISPEEVTAFNKKEPRKVLVTIYTDWCKWCKKLESEVLSDSTLSSYINDKYYPVRLNAESKTVINFAGQTFEYDPIAKVHQLALALLDNEIGYPATLLLDENFELLQPIRGFIGLLEITPIIKFYGGNHYKTTTWDEFNSRYKNL
jgi:thioredoxin-related protein